MRFDHDGYEGWVDNKQMQPTRTPAIPGRARAIEPVVKITTRRSILHLPMGAVLPGETANDPIPISGKITVSGRSTEDLTGGAIERIQAIAPLWLGAPYLWGGRTPWGVDCSGLTQMLFLLAGIPLPRDAAQQATAGELVPSHQASQTGDLAFFQNAEGRVVHVGIVFADEGVGRKIVHASGRVRIDSLDEEGILNEEEHRHTHRLHSIRRMV